MGRRAVAATLASFVIFTTLLLANAALFATENSSLGAVELTAGQVREHAFGGILVGLSAYGSLEGAQAYLQSHPLDCTSPQDYLESMAGSQRDSGEMEGITYSTTTSWSYSQGSPDGGGSDYLRQFGGYQSGDLNLEISTSVAESYDGDLPSYAFQSTQSVHLPFLFNSTISLCLGALSDLSAALSSLEYCNSTGVGTALVGVDSAYPILASYSVGATATPQPDGCSVDYWVTTTETGLEGVSGPFQLTVVGEGSLSTSETSGSAPSSA
ncbi:MAG: hypothetical protein ABSA72_06045 [Nitrososphaerales archaeon]